MLNINRLQLGLENYGMVFNIYQLIFFKGIYPSCIEPSVIICITTSIGSYSFDGQIFNVSLTYFFNYAKKDASITSIESAVLGNVLTKETFRWDYRMYSLVLRFPAFVSNIHGGSSIRSETISPLKRLAEKTGGESFDVYDGRELHQCLDSLVTKCQPGVVLKLRRSNDCVDAALQEKFVKQLMSVKLMGRSSSWPIPEQFWPDDEMLASELVCREYFYISIEAT